LSHYPTSSPIAIPARGSYSASMVSCELLELCSELHRPPWRSVASTASVVLSILGTAGATSGGSVRPLAPSPPNPGHASRLAASRWRSAGAALRRSPRGMPPPRSGSSVLDRVLGAVGLDAFVSGFGQVSRDIHELDALADGTSPLVGLLDWKAVGVVHVQSIYPSVDTVKPYSLVLSTTSQALVEYALIVALVAVLAAATMFLLGTQVSQVLSIVGNALT
jgi:hypothetical protein